MRFSKFSFVGNEKSATPVQSSDLPGLEEPQNQHQLEPTPLDQQPVPLQQPKATSSSNVKIFNVEVLDQDQGTFVSALPYLLSPIEKVLPTSVSSSTPLKKSNLLKQKKSSRVEPRITRKMFKQTNGTIGKKTVN
jgi:hypothetical protein